MTGAPPRINRQLLFKLLNESTSIAVVGDFLKKKQLPFSAGSWEDLIALRLEPALDASKISVDELVELLRTVEEYGRQHIFLFRTNARIAEGLIDRRAVAASLRSKSLEQLMSGPRLYEYPKVPTISDVRWETSQGRDTALIVKEIQSKEHYTLVSTRETPDGMVKTYTKEQERGVNVARLDRSGNLELRIAARSGSQRYAPDLMSFRQRIAAIIPLDGFAEVSLRKAKDALWAHRSAFEGKIRYSEVAARNDDDFVLRAAGGNSEANVSSNRASVSSMENFIEMAGRCEAFNLWFSKAHTPSKRDLHFLISGEVNEFAINASCTKDDYEYVLSELRSVNV